MSTLIDTMSVPRTLTAPPPSEPAPTTTATAPAGSPRARHARQTTGSAGALHAIDALLRDRAQILAQIRANRDLAGLARAAVLCIAAACAVFGAVLGSYRGGVQIAYAAIKFPMLMLLPAAVCAPALTAINAALDRPASLRRDVALMLVSLAVGSLVLVAQAPLLLLAIRFGADYHEIITLTFGCSAVAGAVSLAVLVRGVRQTAPARAGTAATALVCVLAIVGAQMAWVLRPYVVRPRAPDVPFVRSIEGNLLDAVITSARSARGLYHRDYAPLPGERDPDEMDAIRFQLEVRP